VQIKSIENGAVSGFVHEPESANGRALVLSHGAGGNCDAPLLVKVADALANAGWWVLRFQLPFRRKKRFGPPSPATAAEDREGIAIAAEYLRQASGASVALGGHSYGGRQSSMLLSDDASIAEGLLLLSYPLHPPNKPANMRTAHFAQLGKPALFVHGTKDDFGREDEMRQALTLIPARTELMSIEGAGHDLKKGAFDLTGVVTRFAAIIGE
jgi:hypothetical protein